MITLVGGAPSSGSTLLADLLDSTPLTACGPELEFFCNKYLYDFQEFKKDPDRTSHIVTLRATGIFPRYERLPAYGLEEHEFKQLITDAASLQEFFGKFVSHVLTFRGKEHNGFLFEKTPQNINCIGEFLKNYPEGYFITITRNPIFVYNSLLNRKWGNYTALCTWLISSAVILPFLNHERVFRLKYESLVKYPFREIASLLSKITGESITPDLVESGYKSNNYREKYSTQLKSWEAGKSRNIINANLKEIPINVRMEFSKLLNLKVSKCYANYYQIPEVAFKDVLIELGYYQKVMELISGIQASSSNPSLNWTDYRKLFIKWIREIMNGYATMNDYQILLNAVEPAE